MKQRKAMNKISRGGISPGGWGGGTGQLLRTGGGSVDEVYRIRCRVG